MSLKQWIRMGLIATVVLAAFGAFAATGGKKSEAFAQGLLINGQGSGTVTVADGAQVTILATFDGFPATPTMVALAGVPWLAGGTTAGSQNGCIIAPGTVGTTVNPTGANVPLNAAQAALAGAVSNLRVSQATVTALLSNATSDVTAQYVTEQSVEGRLANPTPPPGQVTAPVPASTTDACFVGGVNSVFVPGLSLQLTLTATVSCPGAPITGLQFQAIQPAAFSTPTATGYSAPSSVNNVIVTSGATITCTATSSNLTIGKIDQFGNKLSTVFSVQTLAGGLWVDIARVTTGECGQIVGGIPQIFNQPQQPCTTNGVQALGAPGVNPCVTTNAGCTAPVYPNGLPAGTYRVIEVAPVTPGPSPCTLTDVWQGPLPVTLGGTGGGTDIGPYAPAQLTVPAQGTAAVNALTLTFVNSCILGGSPSPVGSRIVSVIGGSSQGLTNTANVEINPAPGSDDDSRVDIQVRDANNIPVVGAHVTFTTDKGVLAVRQDFAGTTVLGLDVVEPSTTYFGTAYAGDTCDYVLAQSAVSGQLLTPYILTPGGPAKVQDGFTNFDGIISACVFVGTDLAPGTTPGIAHVVAYVEQPGNQFAGYGLNFGAQSITLSTNITVVGPPASITVSASPTTVNCGEKATITATIKDAANQNVSDHTRVEIITNAGGVLGGTGSTLGFPGVGVANPSSSTAAETFNGVATFFLLTGSGTTGPYEVVVTSGGSVGGSSPTAVITNQVPFQGQVTVNPITGAITTAANNSFAQIVVNNGGLGTGVTNLPISSSQFFGNILGNGSFVPVTNSNAVQNIYNTSGVFSTPPVSSQVTVNCSMPVAAAPITVAPAITAPRTGEGPTGIRISPPNTGDAGLAAASTSGGSSSLLVIAGMAVFALAGVATLKAVRR